MKIAEDGKYEIITAAQGVINRLQEAEAQKKTPTTPRQDNPGKSMEQPLQANRKGQRISTSAEKKGSSTPIIIGVIVLAILAAIASYFVMSSQSEEREEGHSRTSMNCVPILIEIMTA